MNKEHIFLLFCTHFVLGIVSYWVGRHDQKDKMQKEAVAHRAGTYIKGWMGKSEFRWNDESGKIPKPPVTPDEQIVRP